MTRRTVLIPPHERPSGAAPANPVRITLQLVDARRRPLVGYTDALGVIDSVTVELGPEGAEVALTPQDAIAGESYWALQVQGDSMRVMYYVQIPSGATPIALQDLLGLGAPVDPASIWLSRLLPDAAGLSDGSIATVSGEAWIVSPSGGVAPHAASHAAGAADEITPALIGAAPAAQGALAATAVQPGDLAPVATTGAYSDLSGAPNPADYEPADATILKDADIGSSVCAQTDARLSDARAPTSHTHAGGDVASAVANATTAVTATNCSRSVLAGIGLTGGGALTANRTLTVAYGSAAGTACQGNDTRLSDARTPTSHTHPSSQISDSTAAGRALLTGADASAQRESLGLGTAATTAATAYATAAQGSKADTAIQPTAVGVSVQAFDSDLSAVAGLSTIGLVERTGAGTATTRAIQTDAADRTVGRIARIDLVPMDRFTEICKIAGMAPTLYLDPKGQDYRIYSAAKGLERKALTDVMTTTRASDGTVSNALGSRSVITSNAARLDFDPVSGIGRGLSIEEARTNLYLNSLVNGANLSTQSVTVTAQAYTVSFFGNGTITLSGAHSAVINGTSDTVRTELTFTPAAGALTSTVSGTVKWANCEAGTFATSHIPTAGAAATRAADVCKIDGSAFAGIWNPSEMSGLTIFSSRTAPVSYPIWVHKSSSSFSNNIEIAYRANDEQHKLIVESSNSARSVNTGTIEGNNSVAVSVSALEASISSNGGTAVSNSVVMPSGMDEIFIGGLNGDYSLNGEVSLLSLFPRHLTNAQLKQLSALGA